MKRNFWNRCKMAWLFVITTQFDKPCKTHEYWSLKWWLGVWNDSRTLGSTE